MSKAMGSCVSHQDSAYWGDTSYMPKSALRGEIWYTIYHRHRDHYTWKVVRSQKLKVWILITRAITWTNDFLAPHSILYGMME